MAEPRIPQYKLSDTIGMNIQDGVDRNYIGFGQNAMLIGGSMLAESKGRISALTMSGSGDQTIELYINNQPQFVSGQPSIALRTYQNPRYYNYLRGDVIKILKVAGIATGGNVALDTESHELTKRPDVVATPARSRLTRAIERSRYLTLPDKRHTLAERWGSFAEATSRIAARTSVTAEGGSAQGGSNAVAAMTYIFGQGHFGGQGNLPPPKPGGTKPGGHHK